MSACLPGVVSSHHRRHVPEHMTPVKPSAQTIPVWIKANLAFLLILLTLLLFVSKSLYNVPVAIMAIIGIWHSIRSARRIFSDPAIRVYSVLFLALWLPLLVSLPDAVNLGHSARTVFPYLRFLFMGIYILGERTNIQLFPQLRLAIFWTATFWGFDAIIQYLTGANLFGYPYEPGHITGMFYPDNTITHLLAAMSPIYFDGVRDYSRKYAAAWLLILPLFAVVIIGGRRAAWLMLAISVCAYLYFMLRYTDTWKTSRNSLLVAAFASVSMLALLVYTNKPLQDRLTTTAGLFSLDYELTDRATARRLPIWETSLAIIRNHWINGIGPRGFRHVYQQYSTEDNYFHAIGATHPHQLLLEVLTETGLVGLAGLLVFIFVFCKYFLPGSRLLLVYPPVLSILIIIFPFNSNLAFYGSYWSTVIWWFLLYAFLAAQYQSLDAPAPSTGKDR